MTQPEEKNAPAPAQLADNAAVDGQKKEVNPEKEAKRLAKLAKFQEKQAKLAAEKAAKVALCTLFPYPACKVHANAIGCRLLPEVKKRRKRTRRRVRNPRL